MNREAAPSWGRAWPVATGLALACVAWPLLQAGFHTDDWIWLAIVRHLDHPFSPYVTGILHEYFYRPSSIALWWLAERMAGHDSGGHYLVDIGVHAASCLAIVALLRRWGVGLPAAMLAGLLFAVAPSAAGTLSWLSNRNELLAVAAGFGALRLLESALHRRRLLPVVALLLALSISSKETGLVFASAGMLRLYCARRQGTAVAAGAWFALLLPVAGLFLMRRLTLWPVGVGISVADAPAGVAGWLQTVPAALAGFAGPAWLHVVLAATVAAVLLGAGSAARMQPRLRMPVGVVLILLALPPLLQWPITHLVFADAGARLFIENLRFFYLATAALAMLLALALDALPARLRPRTVGAVLLLVALPAAIAARAQTRDWASTTGPVSARILALAAPVAARSYPQGCVIVLEHGHWPTAFPTFADAIVKFAAARDASVLDCAVFTDTAPAHSVLPAPACSAPERPGLRLRMQQGVPVRRALGNLCLAGFEAPDASAAPSIIRIHLD